MFNNLRKISLVIAFSFLLLISAGCWDNRDVTEINFITVIGVDKTPDGKIEMAFEIPRPALTKEAGQEGGGGGGGEKPVFIVSAQGDTFFTAARSMLEKLEKTVFPTKQVLLLITEDLAKTGLMEVLDYMERDPESNLTAQMLLIRGAELQTVMGAESEQEKIPSVHMVKSIITNQDKYGSSKEARVIDVLRDIGSPGKDPLIPVIEIEREEEQPKLSNMIISGAAAFRGDKLAGYFTAAQTRGWLLAANKGRNSVYRVPCPNEENKKLSFEMFNSKGKAEVELIDGEPKLSINITVSGDIGETQGRNDLTSREMVKKVQSEVEKVVKEEAESAVSTAQKYKSDVFGFGDIIHRKFPSEWMKMKKDWNEIFSKAPYEITVEAKVTRSGYIRKGTEPK